jgi:hypothetical protein
MLMYVTPDYAARIAQLVIANASALARAPSPPSPLLLTPVDGGTTTLQSQLSVSGNAMAPITVSWLLPSSGSPVDHYVIAARPATENFYSTRVSVPSNKTSATVMPTDLGLGGAPAFFVSVAAVDAQGHESLFAYPEYRCDATGCAIEPDALNLTATQ